MTKPNGTKPEGAEALVGPELDKAAVSALSLRAVDNFEAQVGGREKLLDVLSAHPALTRADRLALDLIADPRFDAARLSMVCGRAGITLGRLLQLYKDAQVMRGQVAAIERIAAKSAPVAQEVLDAAFRSEVPCALCKGIGTVVPVAGDNPAPKECPECSGVGIEVRRPTTADRKLAAEVVGLIKSGGVEVNVSTSAQAGAFAVGGVEDDFFIRLQEATDKALYGEVRRAARGAGSPPEDGDIIEAESTHERQPTTEPGPADRADSDRAPRA